MTQKHSTSLEKDQARTLSPSKVHSAAFSLRKFSTQFGAPALILFLLGPNSLTKATDNALVVSFLIGLGPLLSAVFLRFWSRGYLRTEGFVVDGPYRYVRNPVELGAVLAYIGAGIMMLCPWWFIMAIVVVAMLYQSLIGWGVDHILAQEWGAKYLRYARRVRRWFPSGLPASNRSNRSFSIYSSLRHEREGILWILLFAAIYALRRRYDLFVLFADFFGVDLSGSFMF